MGRLIYCGLEIGIPAIAFDYRRPVSLEEEVASALERAQASRLVVLPAVEDLEAFERSFSL